AAAGRETAAANQDMQKALVAEQEQRKHAEATSALALEVFDRIYDRFAPNRIVVIPELPAEGADEDPVEVPIQPVLSREAAPLLEELLVFYERLAARGSDYAKLRFQAAEANHRIGDVRRRLGQFEQAAAAYQRAVQLHRQPQEQPPNNPAVRVKLARSYNELGRVYRALRQREEERSAHARALATLTESPRDHEKQPAYRYELARTYYFLAARKPEPGEPVLERRPGPSSGGPCGPGESACHPSEGSAIQDALRLLEDLVREYPSVRDYRHLLACCYRDVPPERVPGNSLSARACLDKAAEILQQLANEFPDVPDY